MQLLINFLSLGNFNIYNNFFNILLSFLTNNNNTNKYINKNNRIYYYIFTNIHLTFNIFYEII